MTSSTITLKWRGAEYVFDIDHPTTTVADFAQMVFEKTNVPAERQTIMAPGLKLSKQMLTLQSGQLLLTNPATIKGILVGTPMGGEFINKPVAEQVIQKEVAKVKLPAGYANIGNTCYLGSVLSLLENAKEFRDHLVNQFNPEQDLSNNASVALLKEWCEVWRQKEVKSKVSIIEVSKIFTQLKLVFPEFAGETVIGQGHSVPQQQDSEECLSKLLAIFSHSRNDLNSKYFGFEMEETTKCSDDLLKQLPENEHQTTTDVIKSNKLSCHMGTAQKGVAFINTGIELGLRDEIEKTVESLGCNGVFVRERRLSSLPRYMLIHMVRFEWKKASALAGSKAGRAKVLRRVEYPPLLDVYSFCTEKLKRHLKVGRIADAERREKELEAARAALAAGESKKKEVEAEPKLEFADGRFALRAVVTHTGRSAIEGHYICWVCQGTSWIKMDDDKVSMVDQVDLQGGLADGPCPYILLYERLGTSISSNEADATIDEN